MDHTIPPGALIPSTKMIARNLKIPPEIVIDAFNELTDKWCLLKKEKKDLRYRVDPILQEALENEDGVVCKTEVNPRQRKLMFNFERPRESDEVSRALINLWQKRCVNIAPWAEEQVEYSMYDKLILDFRTIVNLGTSASYSQQELLYTLDYPHLIMQISMSLLGRSVFVTIGTASEMVKNAVTATRKKIIVLDAYRPEEVLMALERECIRRKVGIFYMSSRPNFGLIQPWSSANVEALLQLQAKHEFLILEDDRYASNYPNSDNFLMEQIFQRNADVLYMRPFTHINTDIGMFNLIAGPKMLIKKLRLIMDSASKGTSAKFSRVLHEMISSKEIGQYEKKINRATMAANTIAREVFLNSGLWKEEGIMVTEGWYFLLRPIAGRLPEDYFQQLTAQRIYLMNPRHFNLLKDAEMGVIISIAGYLHDDRLKGDLETLMTQLSGLLIN